MADEDVPPLEDCADLLGGRSGSAPWSVPQPTGQKQSATVAAMPSYRAATSTTAAVDTVKDKSAFSDWGTPEQEMLQKQMIDAALASEPVIVAETKAKEKKVTDEFGKGTAFKAGFLLGSGSKKSAKTAAEPTSKLDCKPSQKVDLTVLAPTASASASGLVLPEVQRAMSDGMSSLQKTVTDKSWMTPELMARIAKEPTLLASMSDPKFMGALAELQHNPKAAMEKYKDDTVIQESLRTFMRIMGDHFSKLGEKQAKESAAASTGPESGIGLTATTTKRTSAKSTEGGPRSDAAGAPRKAAVQPGVDEDVQQVLSNPVLIEILRNPMMQRVLEECRMDGTRLRHYLGIPEIRQKLVVLQSAGLIRIEL